MELYIHLLANWMNFLMKLSLHKAHEMVVSSGIMANQCCLWTMALWVAYDSPSQSPHPLSSSYNSSLHRKTMHTVYPFSDLREPSGYAYGCICMTVNQHLQNTQISLVLSVPYVLWPNVFLGRLLYTLSCQQPGNLYTRDWRKDRKCLFSRVHFYVSFHQLWLSWKKELI